jgi:hypothetical protein
MISGLATINGAVVLQEVIEGLNGHSYLIRAVILTSEGRTLVGSGTLLVMYGGAS